VRALGVEYNPDLVELSRRSAIKAGVSAKAKFVHGDMFEADISQATVLVLFLITDNLRKLTPKFLDLKPGTRIVSNTFEIPGWNADQTYKLGGDCIVWCSAYLYLVPANVAGKWRVPRGELTLAQNFQTVSGTLNIGGDSLPVEEGRLRGNQIRFTAGGAEYIGRLDGDRIRGDVKGGRLRQWSATRLQQVAGPTPRAAPPAVKESFIPKEGLAGKDAVWVPSPYTAVEKMLDLAKVTPSDFVIDLGSGDGRNVIAAAKRGARALGVEYNPDLVNLSKRRAETEKVADKAAFVQGDMFAADISQATVLALFLLPENLIRLTPKFLALKPGTRIVANTFGIHGWDADESARAADDCAMWCAALLYIVPAQVGGTWRLADGELTLTQSFQMVSGTFSRGGKTLAVENGRLRGDQIRFTAGGIEYTGNVKADAMNGEMSPGGTWSAAKVRE
jgi:precorrin-6B methylase 2